MAIETMTPEQYHKMLAEAMSEKALQANVRKLAKDHGWRVYCWWSSLHSPAGWPDLVCIREVNEEQARMVCAELKSEKGKVTPDQVETIRLLRMAGHNVYVWRPSDLLAGRIEEVLA
jgi:hypothetical protein